MNKNEKAATQIHLRDRLDPVFTSLRVR